MFDVGPKTLHYILFIAPDYQCF